MAKVLYILLIVWQPTWLYAQDTTKAYVQILGIAQDGGYPHLGCQKKCCASAWEIDSLRRYVVSFALVDPVLKKWWLFEASPDIKFQIQDFYKLSHKAYKYQPDGIFITHAHIGHYLGLAELGKECINAKEIPVYTLPRLKNFLENNGPWNQLVQLKNIVIHTLSEDSVINLGNNIRITTLTVPHRDEYSETAGFRIQTANRKYLFIPDIDKWGKWNKNIIDEVKKVDIALLDGTFYDGNELPNRNITEIPHPFVIETQLLFKNEDKATKAKIFFIHLNHTNPLMWDTETKSKVQGQGYNIATQWQRL